MCNISNLTAIPCDANPPGTQTTLYLVPASEITTFPAALTTTGAGDTVTLSGNIDFTGQATGKGFFRTCPIVQETGGLEEKSSGELGSQGIETLLKFRINGMDAAQKEWRKQLLNVPLVCIIIDKKGVRHVVGTKDDPAFVQETSAGTGSKIGDVRGCEYTLRATSATGSLVLPSNLTIDVTPN